MTPTLPIYLALVYAYLFWYAEFFPEEEKKRWIICWYKGTAVSKECAAIQIFACETEILLAYNSHSKFTTYHRKSCISPDHMIKI